MIKLWLFLLPICALFGLDQKSTYREPYGVRYQSKPGGELSLYSARVFPGLHHIRGLKRELIDMHLSLYRGYVNETNQLLIKLRQLSRSAHSSSALYTAISHRLGWEFNGMRLHELYFENLGGSGTLDPESPLYLSIKGAFGTFENWRREFIQLGMSRGVGWVVLSVDPKNGDLINQWVNEHDTGGLIGSKPLVVMDVWEHAYITQFGLNRKAYIELFLKNFDWQMAESRFEVP